ncbi:DNA-binding transcriptional LysR family regulator [Rhodoligotrophos appendicifer]|uniref:LysR substrate-binding domain-containing protein n=1 Tax=Rhodoligotrophos appendicifer TaxID=987056 RepID=UPI001186AC23|nr:LysR substrate-binding domain-containing protein [Rhodoligotrophos appendicifer]
MTAALDIDLLKTFLAIAETGSFAGAADDVGRTQSAVSMQMKRLEEVIGKPVFMRQGRKSCLTRDGEQLLDYARRIVRLNQEAMAVMAQPELQGIVRLGTPDDYADCLLPEILARFSRTHPMVQVEVDCQSSDLLLQNTKNGRLDMSIVTSQPGKVTGDVVRSEPLVWATSTRHNVHQQAVLPLAVSSPACAWREMATNALSSSNLPYRIAYSSANSVAISAAVVSGLAVAAIPEFIVRPGMRILGEADGFPRLGEFQIAIVYAPGDLKGPRKVLAQHVTDSLARMRQPSSLMAAE